VRKPYKRYFDGLFYGRLGGMAMLSKREDFSPMPYRVFLLENHNVLVLLRTIYTLPSAFVFGRQPDNLLERVLTDGDHRGGPRAA
jgi:hypothetical protein